MPYLDLSNDDYHRYKGISKSGLDLIARSPAHYRYAPPRNPTRQMEIGTAIHTAILEPERFADEYMLLREVKDRRASEYKQAVKVYGSERTLTGPEADKVSGMQETVYSTPHAANLLNAEGQAERSLVVTDPETGILVRCRYDYLTSDGVAVDLKKTQDCRPDQFIKSVYNYRYHVQAAMYSDLFEIEHGQKLKAFAFLCVEEEAPNSAAVYILDDTAIELGRKLYRRDLRTYAECKEKDEWPGPVHKPQIISLPNWAVSRTEEELQQ